jgi:uncharacterized protein (TIGR03083 family)
MTMDDDELVIRRAIDALDDTLQATIELCRSLSPREWRLSTACPGWTVHDQVAHLAGVEATLLGRPSTPPPELPALAHVTTDTDREVEVEVHARRGVADAVVLDELADVTAARIALLRDSPPSPHERLPFLDGRTLRAATALTLRALDAWTHGEDIRRAVDAEPDVLAPAAELTVDQFLRSLATVVERSGAPEGTVVQIEITEPIERVEVVALDAEPTASPTVVVQMDPSTFCARAAGRISAADAESAAVIRGDRALGRRLLEAMVLTP